MKHLVVAVERKARFLFSIINFFVAIHQEIRLAVLEGVKRENCVFFFIYRVCIQLAASFRFIKVFRLVIISQEKYSVTETIIVGEANNSFVLK